jgi:hypothetical protein
VIYFIKNIHGFISDEREREHQGCNFLMDSRALFMGCATWSMIKFTSKESIKHDVCRFYTATTIHQLQHHRIIKIHNIIASTSTFNLVFPTTWFHTQLTTKSSPTHFEYCLYPSPTSLMQFSFTKKVRDE